MTPAEKIYQRLMKLHENLNESAAGEKDHKAKRLLQIANNGLYQAIQKGKKEI